MGNETPAQKQASEKKEAEAKKKKETESKAKEKSLAEAKAAGKAEAKAEAEAEAKKKSEDEAAAETKAKIEAEEKAAKDAEEAPAKKDAWKEDLDPELVKALDEDGYKPEAILAVKTYKEQGMWRLVTTDGQRHEISFDGEWLTDTKAEKTKKKKDREKAAKKPATE